MIRRILQVLVVVTILVTSFASTGSVAAWSGCSSTITVQWGDTLSGIAVQCGTTVDAIRAANPGLGWWVYAGQVLCIPGGYQPAPQYGSYTVQYGDTLGKIANRSGISLSSLLAVNPQIYNPSLIYVGQVINVPAGVNVPPPPPPPSRPGHQQPPTGSLSSLKIAYKGGMYIRAEPGGTIIASALNKETWFYRPSSLFVDSKGRVWLEVRIFPAAKGYTTGWLLVRDQLGNYFTDPQIDP